MLETIFYTLGIISMSVFLIFCVIALGMSLKIKRDIQLFKESFMSRIVGLLQERNVEVASALGLTVGHFLLDRWKKKSAKKVD